MEQTYVAIREYEIDTHTPSGKRVQASVQIAYEAKMTTDPDILSRFVDDVIAGDYDDEYMTAQGNALYVRTSDDYQIIVSPTTDHNTLSVEYNTRNKAVSAKMDGELLLKMINVSQAEVRNGAHVIFSGVDLMLPQLEVIIEKHGYKLVEDLAEQRKQAIQQYAETIRQQQEELKQAAQHAAEQTAKSTVANVLNRIIRRGGDDDE